MSLRGWLTDLRLGLPTEHACRRAAGASDASDGALKARVLARYDLFLPAHDQSITPGLVSAGRYDPWTGRLIARHVQAGMTVADIGANVGYFTMLMADRVGGGGHVLAFEPFAALAALVRRSAAANGFESRIALHEVALGAEDGREMILVTPGDHLAGSAVWEASRSHESARPIAIRRLDAIPHADRIAFAKIDAEGSEPAIWAGMAGLIAGDALRTVLLEFTPGHYADPAGFVAAIRAAGFSIAIVERARGPVAIGDAALGALPPRSVVNLLLTR